MLLAIPSVITLVSTNEEVKAMAIREVPSLKYVLDNSMAVARHASGYRFVGTIAEVDAHMDLYENDSDYVKDSDLVCTEGQPESLKWFYEKYYSYCEKYRWSTIQDFHKVLFGYAK